MGAAFGSSSKKDNMKITKKNTGTITLESMNQAKFYNEWILTKFDRYLSGSILEVGCGIGNFTQSLTKYGEVSAIDISSSYVNRAGITVQGKAKIGHGDIEQGKYFFNSQKFNTVVCLNVLEHIQNDAKALKNIYRLLEKEGILILLVPAHEFLFGEVDKAIGHFRRYTKETLVRQLESLGFEILKARRLNFLGALGWFIAGRILKETVVKERNIEIFNLAARIFLPLENIFEPLVGTSVLVIAQKV